MEAFAPKKEWHWFHLDERTWVDGQNQAHDIYRMSPKYVRNVVTYIEGISRDVLDLTILNRYFGPAFSDHYDVDTIFDQTVGGDQYPEKTDREQRAYLYPCYEPMKALIAKRAKGRSKRRARKRVRHLKRGF